jgi:hypothetical protein
MTLEVEGLVRRLRERLGIEGFPSRRDVWRIAADFAWRVTVEVVDVPRGYTQPLPKGKTLIVIPASLDEEQAAEVLLEELAHMLLCIAPVTGERMIRQTLRQRTRAFLLGDDRDEAQARAVVLAWKLPAELIAAHALHPERLRDLSGCSLEEIGERWRQVLG